VIPVLATPPPTIAHVYSHPFCTTLRENIAPAIVALRANDSILVRHPSGRAIKGVPQEVHEKGVPAADYSKGMRALQTEYYVDDIVRNLAAADNALSDPVRFAPNPKTDEEKKLADLKTRLLKVKQVQNDSLNLINGLNESAQLEDMQSVPDDGLAAATGPVGQTPAAQSAFGDAPGWTDPRSLLDRTFRSSDRYAEIDTMLSSNQHRIGDMESQLTSTVEQLVSACRP
jgi:hypothetical protein